MNTTSCTCRVKTTPYEHGGVEVEIQYCPMHTAAPKLLSECQRFLSLLDSAATTTHPGEITQAPEGIEQLRAVVKEAAPRNEGKK
jgi:hypothetical protein